MKKNFSSIRHLSGLLPIALALVSVVSLAGVLFASIEGLPNYPKNTYKYTEPEKKCTVYSVSSSAYGNGWTKSVFRVGDQYYSMDYNQNQLSWSKVYEMIVDGCKEGNIEKYGFQKMAGPNH